jgi:flagellin-like hook-associated protein FlgL
MQNAQVAFEMAAGRATTAAARMSSPEPPAAADPDLAEAMVSMMTAQLAYTASAKVLSMTLEHERAVLDLFA